MYGEGRGVPSPHDSGTSGGRRLSVELQRVDELLGELPLGVDHLLGVAERPVDDLAGAGQLIGVRQLGPRGQLVGHGLHGVDDGVLAGAALRPFWLNRPGVMLAGALPAGAVPTELVAATFRPLFGSDWPARDLLLTAVRLSDGQRVVF